MMLYDTPGTIVVSVTAWANEPEHVEQGVRLGTLDVGSMGTPDYFVSTKDFWTRGVPTC